MSSSSKTETDVLLPSDLRAHAVEATEALTNRTMAEHYHANPLTTPIEIVGFWAAIVIPFLYLPLLLNGTALTTIFGLVLLNVFALLAGHTHRRD